MFTTKSYQYILQKATLPINYCTMKLSIFFLIFSIPLYCASDQSIQQQQRKAVYAQIPKDNLRKLLIFSSLHPESAEGKIALEQAWKLLSKNSTETTLSIPSNFSDIAQRLVDFVQGKQTTVEEIENAACNCIEQTATSLSNRSLKGRQLNSLDEIEKLPSEEIDLTRALLLLEKQSLQHILSIETALDLLALEIVARIGENASNEEKIEAINRLLFHELSLRYPPQSVAKEKVDHFSELSSVFSSRRGICLGTTVLYIAIAQRVALPLTVFSPPGHVFLGLKTDHHSRVIETTARGVHIPLNSYLDETLLSVPENSIKEVIGMVAFNRAGLFLQRNEYEKALEQYMIAFRFDQGEGVQQTIALCEFLLGKERKARKRAQSLLDESKGHERDALLMDLANGSLPKAALEAILSASNLKRAKLLPLIELFEKLHSEYPNSVTIPSYLAHSYLVYGKPKKALPILEKLLHKKDVPYSILFLVAKLYIDRMDYPKAWNVVQKIEERTPLPLAARELIIHLQKESPLYPPHSYHNYMEHTL